MLKTISMYANKWLSLLNKNSYMKSYNWQQKKADFSIKKI